ncbi:MAG TPA: S8/S53 family peptidase [Longimicrobiaceae bacterium]
MRFAPHHALSAALLLLLLLGACADQPTTPGAVAAGDAPALARSEGQGNIPTRAEERPGTFADMADLELWDHVAFSDGVALVGLKMPGAARGVYRGEILIDRLSTSQARMAVANQPGIRLLVSDDLLPISEVRIESLEALRALRRLPMVDYVEPLYARGDLGSWASIGGCGWPEPWSGEALLTGPLGDRYSARFEAMRIPAAWSVTREGRPVSGEGITIGLTDTGIALSQEELRAGYSGGSVAGRTVRHMYLSSLGSSDDACGHGTRMAGVIAAPDDGRGVQGVAWGANLVNVRHANGVANISTSAARASVRAAGQAGSRIVSMAWQSMNWWWSVSDEIRWWHRYRGVLFFGAAGTSGCGDLILDSNVVFPADMGEVVAVTGESYPGGGAPCGIHHGKEVELTAYLDVPTSGRYTGDVTSIGGSSNATAVVAGIAALAWQANPSLTRDQLRQRLQQSGAFYPSRNSDLGFGLVDALEAVGGQ